MAEGQNVNTLEQEIAQIEQIWLQKKEALRRQKESGEIGEVPHEKEVLKEVVGEKFNAEETQSPEQSRPEQTPAPTAPTVETPSYLSPELNAQVQELVNFAFAESIAKAVKRARAAGNSALEDAFHDALVDELYAQLIERGKLKKVA